MKKVLIGLFFLWLFIFFLIYAGVFRNNKDPLSVAKFYFECMKNHEWILTYPVTQEGHFDDYKIVNAQTRFFDRVKIKHMEFKLLPFKDGVAFIEARIVYEDQRVIKSTVELMKNDQAEWRISGVTYGE